MRHGPSGLEISDVSFIFVERGNILPSFLDDHDCHFAEHDGVAFEDLPDDWKCPRCKQPKDKFNKA